MYKYLIISYPYSINKITFLIRIYRGRREAVAQLCDYNATIVGSIPTLSKGLKNLAQSVKRSVLTLGSLCLPC